MARQKSLAPDTVIAQLMPSQARRVILSAVTGGMGALLFAALLNDPPAAVLAGAALVVAAGLFVLAAWRIWSGNNAYLELTGEALNEVGPGGARRLICRLDEIERVERGMVAMRPSNGFALRLRAPAQAAWGPGLWWRIGRRVGVGGMTSRAASKAMAEVLEFTLLESRGDLRRG